MHQTRRAIVVITIHKPRPTPFEEVSLKQCFKVFSQRDIAIVCPRDLDTARYTALLGDSVVFDRIDPKWQRDYTAFKRLKIAPFLYKRYRKYEFILFYEPDAFVFRDELDYWCDRGWDYIGAPWIRTPPQAAARGGDDSFLGWAGVGNGGFSLRRVASQLKVLRTFCRLRTPRERDWLASHGLPTRVRSFVSDLIRRRNTFYLLNGWDYSEDKFWCSYVGKLIEWYRVAEISEAMRFSIEREPRRAYERIGSRLPFGCHAWKRCDLSFWRPFIEAEGHDLSGLL